MWVTLSGEKPSLFVLSNRPPSPVPRPPSYPQESENFRMRFALPTAVAAAFALAPLSINAQTAGKNLAIDFRTTVTVSGMPDTGVILGHAVGSGDKLRMDLKMKGPGAQISP